MLIAITILLDILKNEGMTNCDWKANSMKASGQTRIGFPVLVTVTLSLDYLLFRYFQYAFHLDVFSIWRKSTEEIHTILRAGPDAFVTSR